MYRATERMQKRKDDKKQMILDAAAEVFSINGYHGTTIRDIVEEAKISVGSFYSYFDSKENLFIELYRSIAKEFSDTTMSVIDVEHYSMLKNYTRVMMATLWMYEQKRRIARIMLLEASADPVLQKLESERLITFAKTMTEWFRRFKRHSEVNIPDERVAALIYAGSYYSLVNDWLASEPATRLTEYGYVFCVYNLQALRIPFDESTVKAQINEVLKELALPADKTACSQ